MGVVICNFFNKDEVPSPQTNLENASLFGDFSSVIEAVPYITFLYLFQPNVPQTFDELKQMENEEAREGGTDSHEESTGLKVKARLAESFSPT